MFLSDENFKHIIRHTPLVSIDLLVKNKDGHYLLGLRTNEPAKGFWFMPGGRIRKDERLNHAFKRLCRDELGVEAAINDATFYGIYEHLYPQNVFHEPGYSTHYLVLAYELELDHVAIDTRQHADSKWISREAILADQSVHPFTKDYFRNSEPPASDG